MSDRLLTTVQAAEQLCIPAATLRAIRRRGEIAAVNVGTARRPIWRYRQADLDRWVRARTVPAAWRQQKDATRLLPGWRLRKPNLTSQRSLPMTTSLSAPRCAILLDDNCPLCDWPETVALLDGLSTTVAYRCRKCGWVLGDRQAVEAWDAAHPPVQLPRKDEEAGS